jgi:hypothetical protein
VGQVLGLSGGPKKSVGPLGGPRYAYMDLRSDLDKDPKNVPKGASERFWPFSKRAKNVPKGASERFWVFLV